MTEGQNFAAAEAPSSRAIVKATLIALAVSLVLLFTAVLPAEYGIDPLKTGKLLRLTGISQAPNAGGRATPANTGIYNLQPGTYKVDTEEIGLHPGEGFEIKYHMQKGATMVFAWKADGPLQFEFHGEPDQKPSARLFRDWKNANEAGRADAPIGLRIHLTPPRCTRGRPS